jgi:hypothetical protein
MPTPCGTNPRSSMEPRSGRFAGPIGRKLEAHDERLKLILQRHGASRPRVFGSVARGEDREGSDLDLLVEVRDPDYVGLEMLRSELEDPRTHGPRSCAPLSCKLLLADLHDAIDSETHRLPKRTATDGHVRR